MNNIKPGDVFRVSLEKRAPRKEEPYLYDGKVRITCDYTIVEPCHILEPIDAARVTVADEVEPVKPKWFVHEPTRLVVVSNGITYAEKLNTDIIPVEKARARARALCDELNERDTPNPRFEVRTVGGGLAVFTTDGKRCLVPPASVGNNHDLTNELCAAFEKHAKD